MSHILVGYFHVNMFKVSQLFLLNTQLNREVVFEVLIHVALTSQDLNTGISSFDKLDYCSQGTRAKTHRPC
jgi:hypothetical protein